MRKKILIKVSGNLVRHPKVLRDIADLGTQYEVVVICGGGTYINEAFRERGFKVVYDETGRVCANDRERALAKQILCRETYRMRAQLKKLCGQDAHVTVIPSLMKVGRVECHVNSDMLLLAAHKGFDYVFAYTLNERVEKKSRDLKQIPNLSVIGYDAHR